MSAASIFTAVLARLTRGTPRSFEGEAVEPQREGPASRVDTIGNPIGDDGTGERHWRDVEDRAREHQILISCWM